MVKKSRCPECGYRGKMRSPCYLDLSMFLFLLSVVWAMIRLYGAESIPLTKYTVFPIFLSFLFGLTFLILGINWYRFRWVCCPRCGHKFRER